MTLKPQLIESSGPSAWGSFTRQLWKSVLLYFTFFILLPISFWVDDLGGAFLLPALWGAHSPAMQWSSLYPFVGMNPLNH